MKAHGIEMQGRFIVVHYSGGMPEWGAADEGAWAWDDDNNIMYYGSASAWVKVGVTFASAAEVITGTEAAKAIAPDQAHTSLMKVSGSNLAIGSDADGDMYYRASSVLARLAKGTAGQLLKMNSGATAPEWGNTWKGTATNDNAAAGYVGEYVSAHLASGSAVALTSAAAANITSISLTAGDWDVDAYFALGSGTDTLIFAVTAAANSTSATIPATWRGGGWGGQDGVKIRTAAHGSPFFAVPTQRFSLSGTTTIYLVGYAAFSVSTLSMFGGIAGRRVR